MYEQSKKENPGEAATRVKQLKKFLSDNAHDPANTPRVMKRMLTRIRARAKKKGTPFDLKASDFPTIPTHCPVLGIPLVYLGRKRDGIDQAASLDRVDNTLGYVLSNVKIISNRANTLKADASVSELRAVLHYVEQEGVTYDKE